MKVVFGWNLDRAPWRSGGAGATVVTGPLGLLGILQTRLGTIRPTTNISVRIAQYRSLMARADHPWYQRSFADDPWNTALHLLRLRDDAIEAGWQPNTDDVDYSGHPRLDALASVENLVRLGPDHDQTANLAPGRADDLREVLALLRDHGPSWPLGIDSIDVKDQRDDLPSVWQNVLDAMEFAGVAVTQAPTGASTPALTVVRGPDEWSTAEAAARWLANTTDHENLCIIAGDATTVLDHQLARRSAPTIGVTRTSTGSPSGQILPVFLSAILPPTDIRRVAEFLNLSFGSTDSASPAKTLIPGTVSTTLLTALTKEPGISGDPDSAWMSALRTLQDRAQTQPESAAKAWETARTIDGFIRVSPPVIDNDSIAIGALRPALDWLAGRIRALTQRTSTEATPPNDTTTSFIAEAAGHIVAFHQALTHLATETIRVRELFDIAEACAPSASRTSSDAKAAKWTVVSGPAEVPDDTDTIVWWSSCTSKGAETEIWDPVEAEALLQAGARVSSAPERERLRQSAALNGIRSASTLICFCPDRIRGQEASLHPTLSRLAEDIAATEPERYAETTVDGVLTDHSIARSVSSLCDDATWRLLDVSTETAKVAIDEFVPPVKVSREFDGDFTHLLPGRLSFTQIERLLGDPLAWTLERALGLQRGFTFDIPTGNRMIGTLVHAVVEHLVRGGATSNGAVPSTSVIARTFDRLVPRFASELLLPGQQARLGTIRSTVLVSLTHLFTALTLRGISITAAEAAFTYEWELTIAGTPKTVHLGGLRDLEGKFSNGRPAIIDLKWTNSGKRFRTMIDDGEAVQLSIYSRTSDQTTESNPLTGYFLLKQSRFISTDSALDPDYTGGTVDEADSSQSDHGGDPAGLWPRIQTSVEDALSKIAAGRFEALSADAYAEHGVAPGQKSVQVKKAIEEIKSTAIAEGQLFVDTPQIFSDFNLIYGIAGDHS